MVYHFFTFRTDGDIRKFVQIQVKLKLTKLFKCLIFPSILKIHDKEGWPHFKKLIRLKFFFFWCTRFIDGRKSKTIFKSSLNPHVYWDTLSLKLFENVNNNYYCRPGGFLSNPWLVLKNLFLSVWLDSYFPLR